MAILIEGKNVPERYLGIFDEKCQIVVSDLNPGYYKLIVKTLRGGGDKAEAGWDTIKIDRSGFSVEAGRMETITVRQTGG